jgi:TetR/AcrR family transcriptional regulator
MVKKALHRRTAPALAGTERVDSRAGLTSEQRILAAARQEFCERGLDGARMQAIADRAGVNKALVHYYFRSKEKLFEVIIHDIVSAIWGKIHNDLDTPSPAADFRSVIRSVVSEYVRTFAAQPEIPMILMRQLINRDENFNLVAQSVLKAIGDGPSRIFSLFQREAAAGRIKKVDPIQLIMSIMGMIMVTFISRPIVEVLQKKTGISFAYDNEFYSARIDFITNLVFDGIKERSK